MRSIRSFWGNNCWGTDIEKFGIRLLWGRCLQKEGIDLSQCPLCVWVLGDSYLFAIKDLGDVVLHILFFDIERECQLRVEL